MRMKVFAMSSMLLLAPAAGAHDAEGFESWEQYQVKLQSSQAKDIASVPRPGTGQDAAMHDLENDRNTEAETSVSVGDGNDEYDPLIIFGAGAMYYMPYRFEDRAKANRVTAEFSASCAPFGKYVEVGIDLAISRDNTFLVRPNLKFFFIKGEYFSAYMEGSVSVLSQDAGSDVGGGAGLGVRIGFMEHLAMEIRAAGIAFFMSADASDGLFGSNATDAVGGPSFVGFLTAGARLVARF